MDTELINTCLNIAQPVFERSIVLAAEYAKKCGRDCVTQKDVEYSMKYSVMRTVGKDLGSLFPELDTETSETDEIEVVEDAEDTFTRYSGDDELMNEINNCYDTWDTWEPTNPMEKMMAEAIKKNSY